MLKNYFCHLIMVLLSHQVFADGMLNVVDAPRTLTLLDAITVALKVSDDIERGDAKLSIAQGEALLSTSKILPQLGGKISLETPNHSAADADGQANLGLSAKIPLLDLKAFMESRAKRENATAAKTKFSSEKNQLIYDVGELYVDALIAQALMNNALQVQEQTQKQLSALERKAAVGNARMLDLRRSQYLSAKANSEFLLKRQDFNRKLGALGKKIGVVDNFILDDVSFSSEYVNSDEQNLLSMALSAFDITALSQELHAASYSKRGDVLDFLPKLSVNLDGGWAYSIFSHRSLERQADFAVRSMLILDVPLFSGGSTFASIKISQARKIIAQVNLRSKEMEKKLLINQILTELRELEMIKANADIAVDASSEALASAQRMFDNDEATGLELVEAGVDHVNAKNLHATSRLSLERTKLKLFHAIGKISEILAP